MSKKKRQKKVNEETTTVAIKGYLANKKSSCGNEYDPYGAKKKDNETPWYLRSMPAIKESVLNIVKSQKASLLKEEEKGEKSEVVDTVASMKALDASGVGKNDSRRKTIKFVIDRYMNQDLPPAQQEKVNDFYKNVFQAKYNGDMFAYIFDKAKGSINVPWSEIVDKRPDLAREIEAYNQDRERPEKLTLNYHKWESNFPHYIVKQIRDFAKSGEAELRSSKGPTDKQIGKGEMKMKAGRRQQKAPRMSSHEIEVASRKIPGGLTPAEIADELSGDPEFGDDYKPSDARKDLVGVYEKVVDEILYGKGGRFGRLIKKLQRENPNVDLKDAFARYVKISEKADNEGMSDQAFDKVLVKVFTKPELKAILDLADMSDPKAQAQRHIPRSATDRKQWSKFEKAFEPFVRSGLGAGGREGEDPSRGFVHPMSLMLYAKLRGYTGSKDEAIEYAQGELMDMSEREFARTKEKMYKALQKHGLQHVANMERDMDARRMKAQGSDDVTRTKIVDPESQIWGSKNLARDKEKADSIDDMFGRLMKRKEEEGQARARGDLPPRDPEDVERRKRAFQYGNLSTKRKERGLPRKDSSHYSLFGTMNKESLSLKEFVLGIDGEEDPVKTKNEPWENPKNIETKQGAKFSKKIRSAFGGEDK